MKWFGKKKETKGCCNTDSTAEKSRSAEGRKPAASIQILGSGCAKCSALEKATLTALAELGMETTVDHVTDFAQIAAYGVMTTPALVIEGTVVSCGKQLSVDEIKRLIQKARGQTYE